MRAHALRATAPARRRAATAPPARPGAPARGHHRDAGAAWHSAQQPRRPRRCVRGKRDRRRARARRPASSRGRTPASSAGLAGEEVRRELAGDRGGEIRARAGRGTPGGTSSSGAQRTARNRARQSSRSVAPAPSGEALALGRCDHCGELLVAQNRLRLGLLTAAVERQRVTALGSAAAVDHQVAGLVVRRPRWTTARHPHRRSWNGRCYVGRHATKWQLSGVAPAGGVVGVRPRLGVRRVWARRWRRGWCGRDGRQRRRWQRRRHGRKHGQRRRGWDGRRRRHWQRRGGGNGRRWAIRERWHWRCRRAIRRWRRRKRRRGWRRRDAHRRLPRGDRVPGGGAGHGRVVRNWRWLLHVPGAIGNLRRALPGRCLDLRSALRLSWRARDRRCLRKRRQGRDGRGRRGSCLRNVHGQRPRELPERLPVRVRRPRPCRRMPVPQGVRHSRRMRQRPSLRLQPSRRSRHRLLRG